MPIEGSGRLGSFAGNRGQADYLVLSRIDRRRTARLNQLSSKKSTDLTSVKALREII
jgi:hypothetical protein